MANLSKEKRDRMLTYLESLKKVHNDDESIKMFNEIEDSLNEKKYGLVFEEHNEEVDELLKNNIPILSEDNDKIIIKDSNKPMNFIIEGDNLQALYLLDKTHRNKVDCIYIDPPYNTGSKTWKYNNDYVDSNDTYQHSKWLSMMTNRLKIAKRLLNPSTGVLIVTIDENEFHNLRCLLESIFPNAFIQVVTIVINPKGVTQGKFSRIEEYAIYVFMPDAELCVWDDPMIGDIVQTKKVRWAGLLRSGSNAQRADRPNMYYPILIDDIKGIVIKALDPKPLDFHPNYDEIIDGYKVVWPLRTDMSEGHWSVGSEKFNYLLSKGYVSLGKYDNKRKTWAISYLNEKVRKQIDAGDVVIKDVDVNTGVVNVEYSGLKNQEVRTVWNRSLHNAGTYGTDFIKNILGAGRKFPFPKSIYAEKDSIGLIVKNNPNAIVVDFFAGSGTTLNAINLLNCEDNGNRKCIIVTNNECSIEEETNLTELGYKKGDPEWESRGICQAVTWPRTRNTILGTREDGSAIPGEYILNKKKDCILKRTYNYVDFIDNPQTMTLPQKKSFIKYLVGKNSSLLKSIVENSDYALDEDSDIAVLFNSDQIDSFLDELNELPNIKDFYIFASNKRIFNNLKTKINDSIGDLIISDYATRPISDGFNSNVKYLKCTWTERKPDNHLLSNVLMQHIKEMIELQNAIQIDNIHNVLIMNKNDLNKYLLDEENYKKIEKIWINQNIIFNANIMKLLKKKDFKYVPKEFFGDELKEAAE